MSYFTIDKNNASFQYTDKLTFKHGYKFSKRTTITLYNTTLINYVLTTKFNKSLKDIINLYLLWCNDEDADGAVAAIMPRVELLRKILLEDYAFYLDRKTIEGYLDKLEKMERKVGRMTTQKSRSL